MNNAIEWLWDHRVDIFVIVIAAALVFFLIVASFALMSSVKPRETNQMGINRYIDNEAGVLCWTSDYRQGISCLPITETRLNEDE